MRSRFAGLAAALALVSGTAQGQAQNQTQNHTQNRATNAPVERTPPFYSLWSQGNYLAAIALIERDLERQPPNFQTTYMQYRPMLDGFAVLDEQRRRPVPPPDPADLARYDGAVAADAIAAIVERAKLTRVVIVNETHDNPRDRAFVLKVAEALRPLGYTHYAAEALGNPADENFRATRLSRLVADGYARRDTGTYTADPTFGSLLRGVLALGYRPESYEMALSSEAFQASLALPLAEQIAQREQAQAENLARALAAAGPEAKFLIHVGYGHAAERPVGPPEDRQEWMAARLARLTGIDPLTVDQTDYSEYSQISRMRGLQKALAERLGGQPKVFLAGGASVSGSYYGDVTDLQVVHPAITAVRGRPDWLARTGRRAVEIPADLLPRSGRRLVQAFVAGEAADAVPIDQALTTAGEAPPVLYVPDGLELRWAIQDG